MLTIDMINKSFVVFDTDMLKLPGKPDAVTNCSVDNRTGSAVLISCQVSTLNVCLLQLMSIEFSKYVNRCW